MLPSCVDLAALSSDAVLACDICIIGTGPAGAAIARELSGGRYDVIVLESGGVEREPAADELNIIDNVGAPRQSDQWLVRNRVLGGSSATWTGKCVPFDDIDYQQRDWVAFSGWPFAPRKLDAYLDRAAPYLGITPGAGFSGGRFWHVAGREAPPPRLDPAVAESYFWQYSRDPYNPADYARFGPHLQEQLGPNLRLLTGATVTHIDLVASGEAVRGLEVTDRTGRRFRLDAATVILAAGGIENARLLLASNRVQNCGVGNGRDQVGRYLMDHLRGNIARFALPGTRKLRKWFGHYRLHNEQVFAHGMRISEARQHGERLVNCAGWIAGDLADDDPWEALKRAARCKPGFAADAWIIARHAGLLLAGAKDYFIERNGWPRKISALHLIGMCEQVPDPDSRVTLSERTDHLGMARPRIDWRIHEIEHRSLRRLGEIVVVEFQRMGLPAPMLADWMVPGGAIPADFVDVAHPTGTTRMGSDPGFSVVDENCQVHGIVGLFVAGSSVFPTSSHANPTQMVVAMALRLADHVKERVGQELFNAARKANANGEGAGSDEKVMGNAGA